MFKKATYQVACCHVEGPKDDDVAAAAGHVVAKAAHKAVQQEQGEGRARRRRKIASIKARRPAPSKATSGNAGCCSLLTTAQQWPALPRLLSKAMSEGGKAAIQGVEHSTSGQHKAPQGYATRAAAVSVRAHKEEGCHKARAR